MNDKPEPGTFEKRLRFGCGFLFGAVAALFCFFREIADFEGYYCAGLVFVAVISGFLAMRYGDKFWREVSDLFRG